MSDEGSDIAPRDELVSAMFTEAASGGAEVLDYARRVYGAYADQPEAELSEQQQIGLVYAQALGLIFDAVALEADRKPKAAADAARGALQQVGRVRWRDFPQEIWSPEFRKLELQARMFAPLNDASEFLLLGDVRSALGKIEDAAPVVEDIGRILDAGADDQDAPLRRLAVSLATSYFLVGSFVFMAAAGRRKYLYEARAFFGQMEAMGARLEAVEMHDAASRQLLFALRKIPAAAKIQVDASIAIVERRYSGALDLLVKARAEFAAVRPMLTEDMGPFYQFKNALTNSDENFEASIALVSEITLMQSELKAAAAVSDAGRDRIEEMEAFKNQVMLTLAGRTSSVRLSNVGSPTIATNVQMNVQQSLTMQDRGIDEILALLAKLPASPEGEKVKKDAEAAKADKDLATKVEKVAKVIDAAGKVVDAAKHFIPYGPAVVGALKAVFGLLPGGTDPEPEPEADQLPRTELT